jgi:hypothetical protein
MHASLRRRLTYAMGRGVGGCTSHGALRTGARPISACEGCAAHTALAACGQAQLLLKGLLGKVTIIHCICA